MAIPELSVVRLRSGKVVGIDRHGATEDWAPTAGLEGTVVHAYPQVQVYVVEIHAPGDTTGGPPLALLDVHEDDLEVLWWPPAR